MDNNYHWTERRSVSSIGSFLVINRKILLHVMEITATFTFINWSCDCIIDWKYQLVSLTILKEVQVVVNIIPNLQKMSFVDHDLQRFIELEMKIYMTGVGDIEYVPLCMVTMEWERGLDKDGVLSIGKWLECQSTVPPMTKRELTRKKSTHKG